MAVDPCKKYLTDAGFEDAEVDRIINDLPNSNNVDDFLKEFNTQSEIDAELRRSELISKERTLDSIRALREGLIDNTNPFKTLSNLLVGKNGLWINATARSEMRNGRVLKEMNLTNRQLSKMLDGEEFVADLIQELYPFTGQQKTNSAEAFKLAKILHADQV